MSNPSNPYLRTASKREQAWQALRQFHDQLEAIGLGHASFDDETNRRVAQMACLVVAGDLHIGGASADETLASGGAK